MPTWTLPAWAQALIDLLLLVLPGGSTARQVVVVADDLIPVAAGLRDWVLSPAGQKVIADLETLATRAGIDFSAVQITQAAHAWQPGESVGGHPIGPNRGGLMPPGV